MNTEQQAGETPEWTLPKEHSAGQGATGAPEKNKQAPKEQSKSKKQTNDDASSKINPSPNPTNVKKFDCKVGLHYSNGSMKTKHYSITAANKAEAESSLRIAVEKDKLKLKFNKFNIAFMKEAR